MNGRTIKRNVAIIACICMLLLLAGCLERIDSLMEGDNPPIPQPPFPEEPPQPGAGDTLRIGSFDLQDFGTRKVSDPEVVDTLVRIVRTYDVIAIQGIKDSTRSSLPALVEEINSDGSVYNYILSENVGPAINEEYYGYIYDRQRVELTQAPYTYPDPDVFMRVPYIASFRSVKGNFDFVLIAVRMDPENVPEEIFSLNRVVERTKTNYPDEGDFIVLGNFYADEPFFEGEASNLLDSNLYFWAIGDSSDTTIDPVLQAYDRILMTRNSLYDLSDSGVFRFDLEYGLTAREAGRISGHYPVYADFWYDMDHDPAGPYADEQIPFVIDNQDPQMTIYISGLSPDNSWEQVEGGLIIITDWKVVENGENRTYSLPYFNLSSGGRVILYTDQGAFEVLEYSLDGNLVAKPLNR